MIGLYLRGDVLTLDERRSEEDESIGRARDMVLRLLLAVGRTPTGRTFGRRGEEDRLGWRIVDKRRRLVVSNGCDICSKGDTLVRLDRCGPRNGC